MEVTDIKKKKKEYNGNLFDQLALLEDIEEVAKATGAEAVLDLIARKKAQIERKLYQQPPLTK